jgi:hypothetical protein
MTHPLDYARERLDRISEPGGYALILNLHRTELPILPVTSAMKLRRATPEEAEELHRVLEWSRGSDSWVNPYESVAKVTPHESGHTTEFFLLAQSEFRYHVLEFAGANQCVHEMVMASALTPQELEAGPTFIHGGGASSLAFGPVIQRFLGEVAMEQAEFVTLTVTDVADLSHVYKKVLEHDDTIVNLRGALNDYIALRMIPKRSSLRFLGLFAILESLLTHDPKPGDPYDSVTRQVNKKMGLLNRRFARPLDYELHFKGLKREKIWPMLYDLRSSFAHGVRFDFASKFQALGTLDNAFRFVGTATRAVMRQALDEPHLIVDLKEC